MLKKFYKILNFFQTIIMKNMLFFVALGIFKLLSFKIYELNMAIDIINRYILPVFISYISGNLIEKRYGGINSVLVVLIVKINTNLSYISIILISILVSKIIKEIQKQGQKFFYNLEVVTMNILVPVISLVESMILVYIIKKISFNLEFFQEVKINVGIILLLTPIIEVGKIFFLNNILNYTVLFYLGTQEVINKGSSLFFLLETNPGPGLGVLLAIMVFSKRKKEVLMEGILEFIGGIHEIYFLYVLKNLKLIIGLILGSLLGNIIFYVLKISLLTTPSPGSIILILILAEGKRLELIFGILISTLISFFISCLILRKDIKKSEKDFEITNDNSIKKIGVICNGGIGTSLILKNFLLNEAKKEECKNLKIENYSILEAPKNLDFVIIHKELKRKISEKYSKDKIIIFENFLDTKECKKIIKLLNQEKKGLKYDIKINQKKIEELLVGKKVTILKNKIVFCEGEDDVIKIRHYPYGVKIQKEEIYLIVIINSNFDKKFILKSKLEELDENFVENIESEKEILRILKEENSNVK